jgi:type IV pilus assembly protein PilQ
MRNSIRLHEGLWAITLCTLIALGSCPAAAQSVGSASVVACDVLSGDDAARVEIEAKGEWTHRSFRMSRPDRLVVDLMGADSQLGVRRIEGDGRFVQAVRSSQYRSDPNPVTRIVLDLVGNPRISIERVATGLAIDLSAEGSEGEALRGASLSGLAVDPQRPLGSTSPTTVPLASGTASELAADLWQADQTGVAQIAEPQRREADGSYARTMSINMQNADIRTVLRAVADFSGRNIIASPEVQGTVTVALTEVPWREAMAVILRANAFGFVEENGIIRVDTTENLRNEELAQLAAAQRNDELEALTTRIVKIDFANAEEVKKSVEVMLTSRGSIEVDNRTNSLIVNDIPANVQALSELARDLDTKTPQVHIDALMVDIDTRHSQEIGVEWGALNVAPGGANWAGQATVDQGIGDAAGEIKIGTVQDWGELQLTLQALARDNIANIISNPRITTTDNREASILVGQKIPLITQDIAGNPVTQLETIGIRLIVTPHINSDQQITLDVHPEVSDLSSQATVQGGVIINTSEADTRVLVSNGETAVIAGLIRNLTSEFSAGVPVLKDLPLLGALFRTESENREQRELIVFLTPQIVEDSIATDREWRVRDSVREHLERMATQGVR